MFSACLRGLLRSTGDVRSVLVGRSGDLRLGGHVRDLVGFPTGSRIDRDKIPLEERFAKFLEDVGIDLTAGELIDHSFVARLDHQAVGIDRLVVPLRHVQDHQFRQKHVAIQDNLNVVIIHRVDRILRISFDCIFVFNRSSIFGPGRNRADPVTGLDLVGLDSKEKRQR